MKDTTASKVSTAKNSKPKASTQKVFEIARRYVANGLCVIPIRPDGSKIADLESWKEYQERHTTADELRRWFGHTSRIGIGIVCGKVSGNLEVIDIDDPEIANDYIEALKECAPTLVEEIVVARTPRQGLHLIYRCERIEGNQKLALREVELGNITDEEGERLKGYKRKSDGQWCKRNTLIETRGEGGYILAEGSHADCHPTKNIYYIEQGSLVAIPVLMPAERETLLGMARCFNEHILPDKYQATPELNNGLKPGEDFNHRGDVRALLEKHGWKRCARARTGERWMRPNGDRPSATLFDSGCFYNFSNNVAVLESDRAYSPFGLLTALEHKGDFHAAAKALKQQGYGKTKETTAENEPTQKANLSWVAPQPIPDGLRAVPVMAAQLTPEPLRAWLVDIAERLQVPLEFPVTSAIVGLASVIGNQIRIRPKRHDDWTVTPNLWGAIIGRPGVMKSPAISETLKPLYRLIKEAEAEHAQALKDWRFEKEAAEMKKQATREAMKKAVKSGRSLDAYREGLMDDDLEEPRERRYVVNDTTVEKFGELLNHNPRGLLIFRDELTGWLRSLDDEQHAKDRAFFLEAWNGDGSYTYDRIGRGTLKVDCVTTSIFGGIQPSKLESYLRGALDYGDDDDGLMQRFQLIVYPDISKDWKNIDRWPETQAKNNAFAIYEWLANLQPESLRAEQDDEGRWFLRFSEVAQKFFNEWFVDLNLSLRSGGFEHPAIESHFSKYKSLMPSLALIFQLIEEAANKTEGMENPCQISLVNAELAAQWCQFLTEHAKRIYGLGISGTAIHAKTLAKHLQAGDLQDGFTARELYFKGWAGLSTAKAVERPLEMLESLGWIQSVQLETGGKPKTVFLINPRIAELRL